MKTIQDKLLYLMKNDNTPLKTKCADKILVREYIKNKLNLKDDSMFVPILGIYKDANDIDFSKLPNRFVLKCNHGSGYNIICNDKNKLNIKKSIEKLNEWIKTDYGLRWGERFYSKIDRKIFIEENISDKNNDIIDYKFWCFNGNPKFFTISKNASTNDRHSLTFYDLKGNLLKYSRKNHPSTFKKLENAPKKLNEMIEYSKILSKDFKFVRIDMFCVGENVYFGEMTFIPGCGRISFSNKKHDEEVGAMLKL